MCSQLPPQHMSPNSLRFVLLCLFVVCVSSAAVPEDGKHKDKTWALVCGGHELQLDSAPQSGSYIFVYTTFKFRNEALDTTGLDETHRCTLSAFLD